MTRLALGGLLLLAGLPAFGQEQEYEIGSGDVLRVAVLGQPDMTGEFTVDAEGIMSFPFLGKVKASGMSAPELERKLTTLIADGYLRQPHVSVTIKEFHSQRVFVTGEAQRPGPYGLRPQRWLLALLGDIGELTANAGHEIVVVRPPKPAPAATSPTPEAAASDSAARAPASPLTPPATIGPRYPGEVPGAEVFHLSLREVRSGNPEKDFRLEAGDTVYFPRAAQVYVTGYVGRAGALRFEEGLTVFQALNLAGGITERGSAKGVKIIRIVDGKRMELKARPSELLEPEDTIVVPERFF